MVIYAKLGYEIVMKFVRQEVEKTRCVSLIERCFLQRARNLVIHSKLGYYVVMKIIEMTGKTLRIHTFVFILNSGPKTS